MVFELKTKKVPFHREIKTSREFVKINTPGGPKEMAVQGRDEEVNGKLTFIQMVVDVGPYEYRRTFNKGAFGSWSRKRHDGVASRVANKTILTSEVVKDVKNRLGAEVAFDVYCQIQEVEEDTVGVICGLVKERWGAKRAYDVFCQIQDKKED